MYKNLAPIRSCTIQNYGKLQHKAQAHVNDTENMERNAHLHTYEMFRVAIFLVAHFLTVLLLLLLLLHMPFVTQDFFICL